MTRVYLAGGWFDPAMKKAVDDMELILGDDYDVFSPRRDTNPDEGWDRVFDINLKNLIDCDFVVASTSGKDMGILFECGYAFSIRKPIIYYAPGLTGQFNLMLAKSAHRVCASFDELREAAEDGFQPKNMKEK